MPSFCPDCLEAAANDPRFVAWAVAHGLAFDLGEAWERSGAYYWTAEIDDVLTVDPPRLMTGQRMEPEQARAHMEIRDVLARKGTAEGEGDVAKSEERGCHALRLADRADERHRHDAPASPGGDAIGGAV